MSNFAEVLLPIPVDHTYSYIVPDEMVLVTGSFVQVPLRDGMILGVVWQTSSLPSFSSSLKTIACCAPLPPLPKNVRELIDFVSNWIVAPRGSVLRGAISVLQARAGGYKVLKDKKQTFLLRSIVPLSEVKWPHKDRQRLEGLNAEKTYTPEELKSQWNCSEAVLKRFLREGKLQKIFSASAPIEEKLPHFHAPFLEKWQRQAAEYISEALNENKFEVILLEGVTGSGKTEVYFEAIEKLLRENMNRATQDRYQILILLPEIALTGQFLERFAKRFGLIPAQWHSSLFPTERLRVWHGVAQGNISVVVGARSAIFLPFGNLKLIIIDEEHDSTYKQEEGIIYHARDIAIVRARLEKVKIILASATPSLESYVNAQLGRYKHILLPTRFKGQILPHLQTIDLRSYPLRRGKWISTPLEAAMRLALSRKEQILLFLNRRGYAPMTLCRNCGYRFQCPHCSAWLVDHRRRSLFLCHHCGYTEIKPPLCPACKGSNTLDSCGPGVERIAEECSLLFPQHPQLILSSDIEDKTESLRVQLEKIEKNLVDIVIGTQLSAKGHDFPNLTLVGIIDADFTLATGDPRAGERTFQLLTQVTGRAGRAEKKGEGFLQTWHPEHPLLRAIVVGDKEKFYAQEVQMRQSCALPPFTRLAALIISAGKSSEAETHGKTLARIGYEMIKELSGFNEAGEPAASTPGEVSIFGPAEAPIQKIRERYRFRLLIKVSRSHNLQHFVRTLLARTPRPPSDVRVVVDIEPQNFL